MIRINRECRDRRTDRERGHPSSRPRSAETLSDFPLRAFRAREHPASELLTHGATHVLIKQVSFLSEPRTPSDPCCAHPSRPVSSFTCQRFISIVLPPSPAPALLMERRACHLLERGEPADWHLTVWRPLGETLPPLCRNSDFQGALAGDTPVWK